VSDVGTVFHVPRCWRFARLPVPRVISQVSWPDHCGLPFYHSADDGPGVAVGFGAAIIIDVEIVAVDHSGAVDQIISLDLSHPPAVESCRLALALVVQLPLITIRTWPINLHLKRMLLDGFASNFTGTWIGSPVHVVPNHECGIRTQRNDGQDVVPSCHLESRPFFLGRCNFRGFLSADEAPSARQ
jgi:hypothetical protein